jgi:hypothetical protein
MIAGSEEQFSMSETILYMRCPDLIDSGLPQRESKHRVAFSDFLEHRPHPKTL